MKNLLKVFSVLMLITLSASQAFAKTKDNQAKDGEATVVQDSTTTVFHSSALQNILGLATRVEYTWSTSSSAISIESENSMQCTIKGNTPGTARLNYSCSFYIDTFYFKKTLFYYDITIKPNTISVTDVAITPSTATLEIGETIPLSATVSPDNATNQKLNWTSEDDHIASVSDNGVVTAQGAGSVRVWARATDDSGAESYCVVNVNEHQKVECIQLPESEKTMTEGETFEIAAYVLPENAYDKTLTWSSDNENIATVQNGSVTAVKAGECNIKCESEDGSNISASCHIVVKEPEQHWLSMIIPNGNSSINVTRIDSMKLRITPDAGYTIHSITLNGEELPHKNGEITLQKLTHNATLNVVFTEDPITHVVSTHKNAATVKVTVQNKTITVKELPEGLPILVYDTNGDLVVKTTACQFELPMAGIYILRIDNLSYKVAIP